MKKPAYFSLLFVIVLLFTLTNGFSQDIPQGRSNDAPALIIATGRLYLAWFDKDNKRLQITSSTDGINWVEKVEIDEKSERDPSLAYLNGRLYLAWRGIDDKNYANIVSSSDGGQTWNNKITFKDGELTARTGDGPALLSANGKLYLVWTDQNKAIKWISSVEGATWRLERPVNGSTETSPSMGYFNNRIILGQNAEGLWGAPDHAMFRSFSESTGWEKLSISGLHLTDQKDGPGITEAYGRLFVAISSASKRLRVYSVSSLQEKEWRSEWYSTETSDHSPSLAFQNNRIFIAWTGRDKKKRLNIMSTDDGVNWNNKVTFR